MENNGGLSSSSLRHLYGSFEEAGTYEALHRGVSIMRARLRCIIDADIVDFDEHTLQQLKDIPDWLIQPNFDTAVVKQDPWMAWKIVEPLCLAERALRRASADRRPGTLNWQCDTLGHCNEGLLPTTPLPPSAATEAVSQRRMVAATARLALGAAIEAALVDEVLDVTSVGQRVVKDSQMHEAAHLYSDAHKVSVWTSAHAQYVSTIQAGFEEPTTPNIATVPSALTEFDLSDLFMRRFNPRTCGNKNSMAIINILTRSTNPGTRGWDSLLTASLADSMSLRLILSNAIVVSLTAQHPHIHPALRPPWQKRMQIMQLAQNAMSAPDAKTAIVDTAAFTKEAVRRLLASSMAVAPAMRAALQQVMHPAGLLTTPPMALPAAGMEGAMAAFATAGCILLEGVTTTYTSAMRAAFGVHEARARELDNQNVTAAYTNWSKTSGAGTSDSFFEPGGQTDQKRPPLLPKRAPKTKNKRSTAKPSKAALTKAAKTAKALGITPGAILDNEASTLTLFGETKKNALILPWQPPWLGKGSPAIHQKVPLITVAADLWSTAFRARFIVFWAHSQVHNVRMSRLDRTQYHALHSLNSCTKLALQLSTDEALSVQRKALDNISAGISTIEEVATHLGIPGIRGSSSNGGAKGTMDALNTLSAAGPENAARLLVYARAAWVSESVLIANLGARTAGLQTKALYMRLKWPGAAEMQKRDPTTIDAVAACKELPIHSTHLHACTECSRVANACVYDTLKTTGDFNELGVSSSMMSCNCSEGDTSRIRCAKRSSAALRGAILFENDMKTRCVDAEPGNVEAITGLVKQAAAFRAAAGDSGVAARIRRDAKSALEQREHAMACGENSMLAINLVGRAVRVYDDWFTLCAFCAAVVRVHPHNRFEQEICCLRCDAEMLGVSKHAANANNTKLCRYCGKEDDGTSKFKTVKAPLDLSGLNGEIPAPLRVVHYCAAHMRPWIPTAHRTLQTRVILTHLAIGGKPLASTETSRQNTSAEDLGFELPAQKRRRRRRLGR